MVYDRLSFQKPQLLTTADLSIPEATFHLRISRNGWTSCSLLTTRASIADTATVRLLRELSQLDDFAVTGDGLYSVPMGYAQSSRLLASFSGFLSHPHPDERWQILIVFEPHGFAIYGRWGTDDGELLVQDARDSVVNTVFSLPRARVPDWLSTLDGLAATIMLS